MSSPSVPGDGSSLISPSVIDGSQETVTECVSAARHRLPSIPRNGIVAVQQPARAIAFWSAIALPFLHLGLLINGLSTPAEIVVFMGLLAVNLVALYVGHSYRREE